MRNIWFLLSFVLLVFSCDNDKIHHSNLISLAPQNSSIIIKTNSVEGLNSALKNNSLFKAISKYDKINVLEKKLSYLKYLKPADRLLITLGKDSNDSLQISIISKYHDRLFNIDSLKDKTVETISTKNYSITKTTLNNQILYSVIKDSIFFASNDKQLVETAFDKKEIDSELIKVYNTANSKSSLSILINSKNKKLIPSLFLTEKLNSNSLTNYMLLDADVTQDQLLFNGITKAVDSSKSLINVFKNTIPQEIQTSKICPQDIDGYMSFTFNDFKTFNDNLIKYKKRDTSLTPTSVFDAASEIGVLYKNDKRAIVMYSLDVLATQDALLSRNSIETFREVDIYPYDNPKLFSDYLSPFVNFQNATTYFSIDDFIVFSDDVDFLKDIISNYQNNTTLHESVAYANIMKSLSDEASLFTYANSNSLNKIFNSNFNEDLSLEIDTYKASAIQFIYDTDFAHVNAIIKKNKSKSVANSVSEDFSIKLDAAILTNPQFVDNHTNNQKDIVVQDINNNLYLISNDGKVLWKKQLDSKILGTIEQIDILKNGKFQLVFATTNRVFVLDRNGKDVSPFPLKFKDNITQPLSVFDYDNNKDYRFLVTQGKALLMYDKQGKAVSGFTFKKAEGKISTQPKHFRIGKKDYIVFAQGNELEIIDRVGKTRINVKNNITFSGNDIYLYNNKFTTSNSKGDLIQIDENGKLISTSLSLKEKHAITTTSKTLVTLSENVLKIKSSTVDLEFGDYTAPKIFYLNDKIYVSVTDLQSKKVYLFDSLGKPIDNFPLYGNSAIELANIDKERGLEFVVKGDSDTIIVYQIN